jgi:hydroxyethylthiazole kinase-like uncharacterized protein yjeF
LAHPENPLFLWRKIAMYIVTADEMREMDRQTIESFGLPGRILMENAGLGTTRILLDRFDHLSDINVGVVAGRGNNGGDGFVIARYLVQKDIPVTVYLLGTKDQVGGDAESNLKLLEPLNVTVKEIENAEQFENQKSPLHQHSLWVDAIFGTGLNSDVRGYFKDVIEFINQSNKPVLSVDIPSGLNADTGQPCGISVCAHATATFGFAKIGHMTFPGVSYTGDLDVVDIGIPPHIVKSVNPLQVLLTPELICKKLAPRAPDTHKGDTGHLLVVAGSTGKTGAAAMTATSAIRSGAGLVTLGVPKQLNPIVETLVVEAMTWPLPDTDEGLLDESAFDEIMGLLSGKQALALGPGIGISKGIRSLLRRIVKECSVPMVIDADGLNALAGYTDILTEAMAPIILTPHPGEMARLVNATPREIQKDRVSSARHFSQQFNVHLVLKGARTVIAHPDGSVFINPTGNSGMASGGMGDVLTGMIAGFLSQGYAPESAAHLGVYLHGSGADDLAENKGPVGFLASEVMNRIPEEIGKIETGNWKLET